MRVHRVDGHIRVDPIGRLPRVDRVVRERRRFDWLISSGKGGWRACSAMKFKICAFTESAPKHHYE